MDDNADDPHPFDTLDAELDSINERFERGQMRAFGQDQEMIMKSFAEIRQKNEALASELASLRQHQLVQKEEITEEMPWSDPSSTREFQVKTMSLALDRSSLKKVNRALDDVFTSMYDKRVSNRCKVALSF